MAPNLLSAYSAVLGMLALAIWTTAEARWRPEALLASSDRPKFPFGGKRRETAPSDAKSPDLLDEVAGGRYGGGQTILPSLGGPVESTTKLPRLFPDPEGPGDPADDHGFDDDLFTAPPQAVLPPPPPPPPPPPVAEAAPGLLPPPPPLEARDEQPWPREMGLLEAIANLRQDAVPGGEPETESWTADRAAWGGRGVPAGSAFPLADAPPVPFADLAPVEAWETAPAAEPPSIWNMTPTAPARPVDADQPVSGEPTELPDPARAAATAAAWAPIAHAPADDDWELVAPRPTSFDTPAAAPVYETPVYETPVYEAPVYETPVYEAPAARVFEAPAAPVYEAPAARVFEAPAAPVYEAPADHRPVFDALPGLEAPPAFDAPAYELPAFEAPAFEAPAFEAPTFEAPPAMPTTPFIGAAPVAPTPEVDADSWHSWQWEQPVEAAPAASWTPSPAPAPFEEPAEPFTALAPPPPPPPPPPVPVLGYDWPAAPTSPVPAPVETAPVETADVETAVEVVEHVVAFETAEAFTPTVTDDAEPISFAWALPTVEQTSTPFAKTTHDPLDAWDDPAPAVAAPAPRFSFGRLEDFEAPESGPAVHPTPYADAEAAAAATAAPGAWSELFDIFDTDDAPTSAAPAPESPFADLPSADAPFELVIEADTDDDAADGRDADRHDAARAAAEMADPFAVATIEDEPRALDAADPETEVRWASTLLDRLRAVVATPAEPVEALEEFRLRFARGLRLRLTDEQVVHYLGQGVHLLAPEADAQVLLATEGDELDERASAGPGIRPGCDVTHADLCPAVVQGETLHFDNSTLLDACPHLTDRPSGACAAVCIPLQPHGNVRGVVHVTTLLHAALPTETVDAVERASQQVSIRLVELRGRRERDARAAEAAEHHDSRERVESGDFA